MKTHTIEGQALLDRVGGLLGAGRRDRPLLPRALGRQRLPRRSRGEEIPLAAAHRLLLRRLQRDDYRPPLPRGACRTRRAIAELRANAGTQFEPRVVEAVCQRRRQRRRATRTSRTPTPCARSSRATRSSAQPSSARWLPPAAPVRCPACASAAGSRPATRARSRSRRSRARPRLRLHRSGTPAATNATPNAADEQRDPESPDAAGRASSGHGGCISRRP